jgi:hypothetical protein
MTVPSGCRKQPIREKEKEMPDYPWTFPKTTWSSQWFSFDPDPYAWIKTWRVCEIDTSVGQNDVDALDCVATFATREEAEQYVQSQDESDSFVIVKVDSVFPAPKRRTATSRRW